MISTDHKLALYRQRLVIWLKSQPSEHNPEPDPADYGLDTPSLRFAASYIKRELTVDKELLKRDKTHK